MSSAPCPVLRRANEQAQTILFSEGNVKERQRKTTVERNWLFVWIDNYRGLTSVLRPHSLKSRLRHGRSRDPEESTGERVRGRPRKVSVSGTERRRDPDVRSSGARDPSSRTIYAPWGESPWKGNTLLTDFGRGQVRRLEGTGCVGTPLHRTVSGMNRVSVGSPPPLKSGFRSRPDATYKNPPTLRLGVA